MPSRKEVNIIIRSKSEKFKKKNKIQKKKFKLNLALCKNPFIRPIISHSDTIHFLVKFTRLSLWFFSEIDTSSSCGTLSERQAW